MPLIPRPTWAPLPDPEGPDPALAHELEILAAEDLGGIESVTDQAGLELAGLAEQRTAAESAVHLLGLDLALGAEELAAMQREAAGDTLALELAAALQQDAAIKAAAGDAALTLPEA